jgi:hypothetical protein
LLYGTAYYADPAALRSDLRVVALLAVGLVIATAAGVAYAGVLDAQRRRLVQLRGAGEVPADVVQRIGHELDLEDSRPDS